ncbi:protein phosphatase [Roseovarius faecimaris]|uniref:Protein phosphatase n=1 Tax=Roseovarius faecimaris TaxID=2494550 RepID=A0A6I6ITS7_9RHOB|nr:protein-tyrosine phosphatase family protein [Roseovarius faecimaris]QGX99494.1 protein phosphatase [Roseovarius faecimaris]
MSEFVIHALPVAGGILALAPLPGRGGAYAEDLAHLKDWKPALVLSLTTEAEMAAHEAANLGPHLQDAGTRWAHLPVPDYGTPEAEQEELWHETSRSALAALQGGGRVLIHCKGGCGRSGMAALRMMIEAGEDPKEALRRLRSVRPCAVETEGQMAWALRG